MMQLLNPYINKDEWLVELGFDSYAYDQQNALWELVMRGVQTTVMDVLLDRLSQADQRQLVQFLSEDDVSEQVGSFLQSKIPDYNELITDTLLEYRRKLKHDLSRLVRKPED